MEDLQNIPNMYRGVRRKIASQAKHKEFAVPGHNWDLGQHGTPTAFILSISLLRLQHML
jgi:hypothetical protein